MLLFIRCGEKDLPNLYIHPFYTWLLRLLGDA